MTRHWPWGCSYGRNKSGADTTEEVDKVTCTWCRKEMLRIVKGGLAKPEAIESMDAWATEKMERDEYKIATTVDDVMAGAVIIQPGDNSAVRPDEERQGKHDRTGRRDAVMAEVYQRLSQGL